MENTDRTIIGLCLLIFLMVAIFATLSISYENMEKENEFLLRRYNEVDKINHQLREELSEARKKHIVDLTECHKLHRSWCKCKDAMAITAE